jgi:ribosomal protein S18 acetylase RimI-like enzyme
MGDDVVLGPSCGTRRAVRSDVPTVAELHRSRFPQGFLPTLGSRPLERLYHHIVQSSRGFVLVADDAAGVNGFVAATDDTRQLYREFFRRHGVAAALVAAPAALRAPRKVWETIRYGDRAGRRDLPAAEILAVAVATRARGTGVATNLLAAALDEFRTRKIAGVRVVTSVGNSQALRLYQQAGFRPRQRIEVHRGVSQEVLVWP